MDDYYDGLFELMQEPPARMAAGFAPPRRASDNPDREGRHLSLDVESWQADDFMHAPNAGYTIVYTKKARQAGMASHRGVLHPDEYVNETTLVAGILVRLDCTLAEFREVYGRNGGGPLPLVLKGRRGRLDAVMRDIAERGGNLALMARQLGVPERNLQNAAKRASNLRSPAQPGNSCAAPMPSRNGRGASVPPPTSRLAPQ